MSGEKYFPKSVAVDLDGVLAQYDGRKGVKHIGEPHDGALGFMLALREAGYRIIVHTARTCLANKMDGRSHGIIEAWLKEHGFKYDEIWTGEGKPIAAAYVDDRAVQCDPDGMGSAAFPMAFDRVKALVEVEA